MVFTCLQYKSFENTVGKGEIAHNKKFLLFPHCFLPVWRTFCHFHQMLKLSSANYINFLNYVIWERVDPLLHIYLFQHNGEKSFRKTLWKKVSNVTFFHNVFYAICILKTLNSHISVVVCSFFEFGTVSKWCTREWVKKNLKCCHVVEFRKTRRTLL